MSQADRDQHEVADNRKSDRSVTVHKPRDRIKGKGPNFNEEEPAEGFVFL